MSKDYVKNFSAKRLEQILSIRGFSQKDFASSIEVSKGTLSKWANGTQKPRLSVLKKMSLLLNVRPEFFIEPFYTGLGEIHFRRKSKSLHKKCKALKSEMEWEEEIVKRLGIYLDLPEPDFPIYKFDSFDEISDGVIEEAALKCRKRWGLSEAPIQDLMLAAESAGCIVVRKRTNCPTIDGFSSWSSWIKRPLIFLSSDKNNFFRSRLDLAHEIGHLCLHSYISHENIRYNYTTGEKQAHKFAGALLLPARPLSRDVSMEPNWGDFLLLKKKWGVSVAAMIKRLRHLDLISEEEEQRLFKRRNMLWGNTREPGDDKMSPEEPRLLRRSLNVLLENNILTRNKIGNYFYLSNADLKKLMFLPDDYFSVSAKHVENVQSLHLV